MTFHCILYTPFGGPALLGELRAIGEEPDGWWTVYVNGRPYLTGEDYIRLFDTAEAARHEQAIDRKLQRRMEGW